MIDFLVVQWTLVLIRVASFVAFLPPTAGRSLPTSVKVGLAVALSLGLPSGLATPGPERQDARMQDAVLSRAADDWLAFALLGVRETACGVALALCLGLVLLPARMAGAYIAQEMGLSIATLTGPADEQQTSVVGALLETLAGLLFFGLNLHLAVIEFLSASFHRLPAGQGTIDLSSGWWLDGVTTAIEAALLIAAPVGIVLMLTLVSSLVLMRSVPQFNLLSVGMSIRLIAGLGGLLVFGPETLMLIRQSVHRMLSLVGG